MDGMRDPEISSWFRRRTRREPFSDAPTLARLKRSAGVFVTVCLPALDEAATVGIICERIASKLGRGGLVDELVMIDSGSSDGTPEIARAAGATVHQASDILPRFGPSLGKGDALWRSLAVTSGDIIVWLDSDVRNFTLDFVTSLLAPLLEDQAILFAKPFYDRPLSRGDSVESTGGARVTELVARPLLNLLFPRLMGFIQPLSGEYAVRRSAVTELPFFTGYAVDAGLLIDAVERYGLDAFVQVDLGTRVHRNQDVFALGRMSYEILHAILRRADDLGRVKLAEEPGRQLLQFLPGEDGPHPHIFQASVVERPPMSTV
ncbi:MAG: glucosyl-3-phosphoglycerate synthase [Actinomycetota bacterium]